MKKRILLTCLSIFTLFSIGFTQPVNVMIEGQAVPCWSPTGQTFNQGQTINIQGEFNIPAGSTFDYVSARYVKIDPITFAIVGQWAPDAFAGGSPFNMNYTIPAAAEPSTDPNFFYGIQVYAAMNGFTSFDGCIFFLNVQSAVAASVSVTSLAGTATPGGCDSAPGITLTAGQPFNISGDIVAPAGATTDNLRINYQLFDSGFGFLYSDTETLIANPPASYSVDHTIDANAVLPSTGDIALIQARTFYSDGSTEFCNIFVTVEPTPANIPTMGEWGLIILFLLIITSTLAIQMAPKVATSEGQTVYAGVNFRALPFDKNTFAKYWGMTVLFAIIVFAIAIGFFEYELTNADPTGSIIASGVIAYFLMLLKNPE